MTKRRGAYISFDGGEGTGKSTQVRLFQGRHGDKVVGVREPGQSMAGQRLRALLLDANIELTDMAELLLFNADRNLTYQQFIRPLTLKGRSVISDRSYLSTLAYQHYGRGLPRQQVDTASELALGGNRPDMHVIFDAPYEQAFARMAGEGKVTANDRFESEQREFHVKVRNGFWEIARDLGERAVLLDASGTIEETYQQLDETLGSLIEEGVPA